MKTTFKPLDPNDCILQSNRIDIWQYPLHIEYPKAQTLLNKEELDRAQRYHFDKHRRRFTIARAVQRLVLARYTAIPAQDLIFDQNQYGKPCLANMPELQFNLSHSGETALLAIGKDYAMGIDLEYFAARPFEGIGSHMFSPSENHALKNAPDMLKPLVFFHIWAQKEALIKAVGMGLSYPTREFDVPAMPPVNQTVFDGLHNTIWNMLSFQPQTTCCAALCYHPEISDIRYTREYNLAQ